jgi:hypothetical protein
MRVMRLLRVLSSPYPIHRKLRTVRNCNSSRGVWGKPSKSSKPSHTRLDDSHPTPNFPIAAARRPAATYARLHMAGVWRCLWGPDPGRCPSFTITCGCGRYGEIAGISGAV